MIFSCVFEENVYAISIIQRVRRDIMATDDIDFAFPIIELDKVPFSSELTTMAELKTSQYSKFAGKRVGLGMQKHTDYRRWAYMQKLVEKSDSLLDVGVGAGEFVNAVAMSGAIDRIVGVDVKEHSRYVRHCDNYEMIMADISNFKEFQDNEFSTTVCLEVIEHLPDGVMEKGIEQVRRVTSGTLYMSVPFEEPEPIFRGHYQRYDQDRIESLFPNAEIELMYSRKAATLSKGYCPIALITEKIGASN